MEMVISLIAEDVNLTFPELVQYYKCNIILTIGLLEMTIENNKY